MEKIDVILKTEAKRRSNLQPESLRWNPEKHTFEVWNGTVWVVFHGGFQIGDIKLWHGALGGSDARRPLNAETGIADESWEVCDGINGTPNLSSLLSGLPVHYLKKTS